MFKRFISPVFCLSALGALFFSVSSHAGKEDFTQKIEIASSNQSGDGIAKKSRFWGSVIIRQGSLVVEADEVEVDASLGKDKEIFIAIGSPAQYSQQQQDGSTVSATANRIEYRRETRALSLDGNAEIQQNNSSVKGESILFNMQLEQIIAQGENNEQGRVITVFEPEKQESKSSETLNEQEKQP